MAFSIKTWIDRLSEFPNRRRLDSTGITNTYDVTRSEGVITAEGNKFNAAEMNDLEQRISDGFADTVDSATLGGAAVPKSGTTLQIPVTFPALTVDDWLYSKHSVTPQIMLKMRKSSPTAAIRMETSEDSSGNITYTGGMTIEKIYEDGKRIQLVMNKGWGVNNALHLVFPDDGLDYIIFHEGNLEAAVKALQNERIQHGTAYTPASAGKAVTAQVTFPIAFSMAPNVVITPNVTSPSNMLEKTAAINNDFAVTNISTTGFTLVSNQTGGIAYNWIAVG